MELLTVPMVDENAHLRRAKCCGAFRGPWRASEDEANADLLLHYRRDHARWMHRGFVIIERGVYDFIAAAQG